MSSAIKIGEAEVRVEKSHLDRQPQTSIEMYSVEVKVGLRHELLIGGGCRLRNMDILQQNHVPDGKVHHLRSARVKTCLKSMKAKTLHGAALERLDTTRLAKTKRYDTPTRRHAKGVEYHASSAT